MSAGGLLRAETKKPDSIHGKKIRELIENGNFAPSSIVVQILLEVILNINIVSKNI